jgi:hypothetical protein
VASALPSGSLWAPSRREVKQVSPGSHNKVCVIGADRVGEMSLMKEIEEVLSAQGRI